MTPKQLFKEVAIEVWKHSEADFDARYKFVEQMLPDREIGNHELTDAQAEELRKDLRVMIKAMQMSPSFAAYVQADADAKLRSSAEQN